MDSPCSSPFDDLQEPLTPERSPSRLDFCMEDAQECDDSPPHAMDWACTSFRNGCPLTFIDEDAFAVDIAPLDHSHLLISDPPQYTDSHNDTSHMPPSVILEPRAPIPVRPPSVQLQADAQEYTPPSRTVAQRLNYPHHGFSRSALQQQKTFWSLRHEEWAGWQSRREQGEVQAQESIENDAYTGLATPQPHAVESPPSYRCTPPSGLERDLTDHPPKKHEQDVHSPIYPRVGDISALRDPYSANVDRCFFRYPLWTLQKTLYVFDMIQRPALPAPSASVCNTAHSQSSMSSPTWSSHTSSTLFDEESDSTLGTDDNPMNPKGQVPSKSAWSPHNTYSWGSLCGWELSWYARWELLLGLLQHDHFQCEAVDMMTPLSESKAPSSSPPAPRFTIGVEDESEEDEDDDEEDYGTLISNPSFRINFEEECNRAIAFYRRESKRLGIAS